MRHYRVLFDDLFDPDTTSPRSAYKIQERSGGEPGRNPSTRGKGAGWQIGN